MNKAVVLGCNYYIGLRIIRSLGKKGVHVVAGDYDFSDSYCAKSKYISEFLKINTLDKIDDKACCDLLEYGKSQEEKPVLLPAHDKYVEFIDNYYAELSKYFLISQAPGKLNSKLVDKNELYILACENGVKLPLTVNINESDFTEKIEKIGFPCIIKPVDTVVFTKEFRQKVFYCNDSTELQTAIDRCRAAKIDVLVQEIIPGFDDHMLTYDSFINRDGVTTHYMTAQKLRQWPINFGASVFTMQKYNQKVIDIGKPFLEKIGYRGFSEIEFKKHEKTGEIYLIEVNVRTTNFDNLINKVGIDMPYLAYKDLTCGLSDDDRLYVNYDTKYAFIYGKEDFAALLAYSKSGQMSFFKGFFQIFTKKLAPAIWMIGDNKPWIYYNYDLFKGIIKKIFRRG